LVAQCLLEQEYDENGQKTDSYCVTKNVSKTLDAFEKVRLCSRSKSPREYKKRV
jgi:hypothetical protein